jgi:hypothetical protein
MYDFDIDPRFQRFRRTSESGAEPECPRAVGRHDPAAEWVQAFTPDRPALTDPHYAVEWMV